MYMPRTIHDEMWRLADYIEMLKAEPCERTRKQIAIKAWDSLSILQVSIDRPIARDS